MEIKLKSKLAEAMAPKLELQQLMYLYSIMNHTRLFEETCSVLYTSKDIAGFCHLYSGQEAVGIGIQSILQPGDNVITGYRCHAHAIIARMYTSAWKQFAEGKTDLFEAIQEFLDEKSQAKSTLAELMGKQNGSSKGKGGSMHLYDADYNFYGGHGIVGLQSPLGAGLAFADKYRGKPNVTFASCGDGAMNQGQIYEAFNMASLWKLPVIFVIENNGYGIGTATARAAAGGPLHERARPFGIESHLVDGMNITEVIKAAEYAREYALNNGPVCLEMNTYRYRPHSMSDPATYRTKEEVKQVRETRDPIDYIKGLIISQYGEQDFAKYEAAEEKRIEEVVEYCKDSPLPGEEELTSDIWASPLE